VGVAVCLAVDAAPRGDRVALADESGKLFAVLEVEETYEYDKQREAQQAFRTTDEAHPGVARLYEQRPLYLAGPVTVFERRSLLFPSWRRTLQRHARNSPSAAGAASSASRRETQSTGRTST